jgi:hydroxymethylbilane synthase
MNKILKIGTRGSKLALWQANFTQTELTKIGVESEIVIIKTQGDLVQHLGFDKLEGKGFFTKEIEDALLRGEIDVAVHSMKDLPTSQPEGLAIAAVSYREDPADWLIIRPESHDATKIFQVKQGAIIGTSANRRKAQMLDYRPDTVMKDIRGNVPTRLEKLKTGDFDAIFLAGAGVRRLALDLSEYKVVVLNPREFVPSPAQGVLAWQTNQSDTEVRKIFRRLHQSAVSSATNIERKVLKMMAGGCQLPLGVHCEMDAAGNYHAFAACQIGEEMRRVHLSQSTTIGLADKIYNLLK